jgi:hypothetical protein
MSKGNRGDGCDAGGNAALFLRAVDQFPRFAERLRVGKASA